MTDSLVHKGMRKRLADSLKEKKLFDSKILEAILKVPRHWFVPKGFEEWAYKDVPFPIGSDQTISQPFTVAFQTQLLEIKPGDKVLEIGTGSGYQAAILHELGAKVYTLERQEKLFHHTASFLKKSGYQAIRCYLKDGFEGLPKQSPFDKIIVTCGAPFIPLTLVDQMAVGGIMVIPVGEGEDQTMKTVIKLPNGKVEEKTHGLFRFVPFLEGLNS